MDQCDARLEKAFQVTLNALLAERNPQGHWTGELSTSALSTATAISALALVQKHSQFSTSHDNLIAGGLAWLAAHQNADGGWGDTVKSISNISTSMLCRAALHLTGATEKYAENLRKVEAYLNEKCGRTPAEQAEAIRARYGKDRTFAVPILTTCALAGLVDWREVTSLPFELACFPQSWFRFLRLPVVSYALPALIAIGQAIYHHRPPRNPLTRLIRRFAIAKSLRVLESIQPSSGGFLEATPLTSFVTLSLASIGQANNPVAKKGVEFIVNSVRPDGSWPIDSNLATWVTTLAVNALVAAGELESLDKQQELLDWILKQQIKTPHLYTGAYPGGWGWTDLPGSVPDADDTPGTILCLKRLLAFVADDDPKRSPRAAVRVLLRKNCCVQIEDVAALRKMPAVELFLTAVAGLDPVVIASLPRDWDLDWESRMSVSLGLLWLRGLQNPDGGWPTFCRGWGTLPFDRSGSDLTAHVLRSLAAWRDFANVDSAYLNAEATVGWRAPFHLLWNAFIEKPLQSGLLYLETHQRLDGSWLPLWFGNQHAPNDENPTYGTARVLAAYRDLDKMDTEPARRGVAWLLVNQNDDGGWGGVKGVPSSMEETALAVEILLDAGDSAEAAVHKGLAWLIDGVEAGRLYDPTPIGFYFAKLWYFEKLYPIIFTVAALGRARRMLSYRRNPG